MMRRGVFEENEKALEMSFSLEICKIYVSLNLKDGRLRKRNLFLSFKKIIICINRN